MDRVGIRDTLECIRREPGDARQGALLGPAAERRRAVSDCRQERLRQPEPDAEPDDDRITPKLRRLHFYQLALPRPFRLSSIRHLRRRRSAATNSSAERRKCNNCHVEPLWTEPGWNMHTAAEVCVDDFQANRAPDKRYRTAPLAGLFAHQKGGFYHDGRFATLNDVIEHYNSCMNLGLTNDEKSDLIAYLLTL